MLQVNFSMANNHLITDSTSEKPVVNNTNSSSCTLKIENVRGLHARASAKFVKCAELFTAEITVTCKGQSVPGTSILGLMLLGASPGTEIMVTACGSDQLEALKALEELVRNKFGEDLPEDEE